MQTTRSRDDAEDLPDERLVGSDRVLAVLTELAGHPDGVGLDEIARAVKSPKPTAHRALAALRRAGFASQDGRGHYVLGDHFLRMAFAHHEARPTTFACSPFSSGSAIGMARACTMAVLDGRSVVYRATFARVDAVGLPTTAWSGSWATPASP